MCTVIPMVVTLYVRHVSVQTCTVPVMQAHRTGESQIVVRVSVTSFIVRRVVGPRAPTMILSRNWDRETMLPTGVSNRG